MSGGGLNYWNANDPIEEIKKRLMFAKGRYSPETIQIMQEAIKAMRKYEDNASTKECTKNDSEVIIVDVNKFNKRRKKNNEDRTNI